MAVALPKASRPPPPAVFAATVFLSAALVFTVEPMVGRLVLPLLGGGAAVWNTSLAFFQVALLVGYVYAHFLQKIRRIAIQVWLHVALLAVAAATLPMHITTFFGEPSASAPGIWLVGVLIVSVGAPFTVLSATAPLVQAWRARFFHEGQGAEPYSLYAASNLGSLLGLLCYPFLIEPLLTLHAQTVGWAGGYGVFVLTAALLGIGIARLPDEGINNRPGRSITRLAGAGPDRWHERISWLLLAAAPSSLMLGVTNFVAAYVGSAPFLWVVPLALYLGSFVIAFQSRPILSRRVVLAMQATALAACALFLKLAIGLVAIEIHLACFFLTALMCHQALVARRPEPGRLTEFYIWMGLGGVVGGGLNAFVAPVLFHDVVEYPAVLALACLARPWGALPRPRDWAAMALTVFLVGIATILMLEPQLIPGQIRSSIEGAGTAVVGFYVLMAATAASVFLRSHAVMFMCAIAIIMIPASKVAEHGHTQIALRDFFGVLHVTRERAAGIGTVTKLVNGTILHGAQASAGPLRCYPMLYYAPTMPIGEVLRVVEARKSEMVAGVVGLGTGAVAVYTRPTDRMRFFELDPNVVKLATDPKVFSYVSSCARGHLSYVLGDARLTLAKEPAETYDVLLIDAFSSDSVPVHLLTVEAVKMYLAKLAPDGILILHLSARYLDLMRPADADALASGAFALQRFAPPNKASVYLGAGEEVVVLAKDKRAIASLSSDGRWSRAAPEGVAPWTDDYSDVFGALLRNTRRPTPFSRP